MIDAKWLFLIIPLSAAFGFLFHALLSAGKEADKKMEAIWETMEQKHDNEEVAQ